MIAEIEDALIAWYKAKPTRLVTREVESLPDMDGEDLVKKLATVAPAIYVTPAPINVQSGEARLKFGVLCVARNSRGHAESRKGDGKAIGVYQLLDLVSSLTHDAVIGDVSWHVTDIEWLALPRLYQAGIYAGVVRIETIGRVRLNPVLDPAALDDFVLLDSQYDIAPHVSHQKWTQEPPDHSSSAPELHDQLQP